jgi:hypothetical protein
VLELLSHIGQQLLFQRLALGFELVQTGYIGLVLGLQARESALALREILFPKLFALLLLQAELPRPERGPPSQIYTPLCFRVTLKDSIGDDRSQTASFCLLF